MDKCIASENGICRNVFGYGIPCNGYSNECSLKPHYDTARRLTEGVNECIKGSLRIKGDIE